MDPTISPVPVSEGPPPSAFGAGSDQAQYVQGDPNPLTPPPSLQAPSGAQPAPAGVETDPVVESSCMVDSPRPGEMGFQLVVNQTRSSGATAAVRLPLTKVLASIPGDILNGQAPVAQRPTTWTLRFNHPTAGPQVVQVQGAEPPEEHSIRVSNRLERWRLNSMQRTGTHDGEAHYVQIEVVPRKSLQELEAEAHAQAMASRFTQHPAEDDPRISAMESKLESLTSVMERVLPALAASTPEAAPQQEDPEECAQDRLGDPEE